MKTLFCTMVIVINHVSFSQSKTIFETACKGDVEVLDSLLQTTTINKTSKNGSNLLHFATYCNNDAALDYLIQKEIDINHTNTYGDTPLMYAVLRRNVKMTKALIAKGAKVNTVNRDNLTPLYNAVQSDNKELVDILLNANADVNLGASLLHKAVINNSLEVVKKLVDKTANMEITNDYGNTPLALAIREDNPAIAEFLITKGADLKKVPTYQLTGAYLGQKLPDSVPLVFAKSFISTENFVHSPTFSSDGNELYYTVESWRYHGGTIFGTKQVNGIWSLPKPIDIDGDYREIDPYLSKDNNTMYYCTNRPIKEGDSVRNNSDLWMLKRNNDSWSKPIFLGEKVNSQDHNDWFPTLSNSGLLYFSTGPDRSSNIVYASVKNGIFSEPTDLGPLVNSNSRDYDPVVAPDERYIIFSSNRENGFGSVDLYISFKNSDGNWEKAINMGDLINTDTIEFAPRLSPDGKFLFFNRGASIYWVSTKCIDNLRGKH
ncbi:ankyrin repeat domain-containing protein [Spongiivirga sp. MCCC 1A20706]|uniref:ankyrin repeat domain-containing protein n=1 Tax=Spongiivirga sp. MCCC 1A20706 TaxID=3160963 RepID=UPI0039773CF6